MLIPNASTHRQRAFNRIVAACYFPGDLAVLHHAARTYRARASKTREPLDLMLAHLAQRGVRVVETSGVFGREALESYALKLKGRL